MLSSQVCDEHEWLLMQSETSKSIGKTDLKETNTSNNVLSDVNHRSLDEYFEVAFNFNQHHFLERWKYVRMILALGLCSIGDATEMLSIGYVLSDPTFQQQMMHNDMNKNGALITSSITAGMIIGALLAGVLEYKYCGRRWIILAGLIVSFTCGVTSSIAPNILLLALLRFAAGVGVGAIQATQCVFAAEISPPNERGFIVSTVSSFFLAGVICNSLLGYLIFGVIASSSSNSWREFLLLTKLPTLAAFILTWSYLPESPRFLALTGNYDEAASTANHIAMCMIGFPKYHPYLAPLHSTEIFHHHPEVRRSSHDANTSSIPSPHTTEMIRQSLAIFREFYFYSINTDSNGFTTRKVRWIAIFLQFLYVTLSSGSAINVWMNVVLKNIHVSNNVYFDTLLSSIFSIPGAIICTFFIDEIGRRTMITWAMALSGLSYLTATWISTTSASNTFLGTTVRTFFLVMLVCLSSASMSSAWTVLNVMISESFPTRMRSAAFAICSIAGRCSLIATQFINGAWMNDTAIGASALLLISSGELLTGAAVSLIIVSTFYTQDMTHCPMKEEDDEEETLLSAQKKRGPLECRVA